jgi:glycerol uptake facilitator protein
MKPKELLAVFFGTFILLLLGDGVVANAVLGPKLAGAPVSYNWNTIAFGWAFAVAISGLVAGADNNPAVTVAMAIRGVTLVESIAVSSGRVWRGIFRRSSSLSDLP